MAVRFSSVFAILFGTIFLSTGQGLHQALIPIAAETLEFQPITLSILASVYFGGYLAGCLLAPFLIKRVSHSRTLAIAASLLSILSLLHIIYPVDYSWMLARFFVGYCFANIDVVLESWLADRAAPEDRGKLLSVYRLIDLMALGMGQTLIAMASPTAFLLFALVAILVSVAVIVVCSSIAPPPSPPDHVQVRILHVCKLNPLAVTAAILHGIASGIYWGFAPIFASKFSTETFATGIILASTLFGAAAAQYPVGWASDKYDRRKLIMALSLAACISSVLVMVFALYLTEAIVFAMFVFGATSFCIYPVAMTYAFDRGKPEDFVEIGASVLVVYGFGALVGPILAPYAMAYGNGAGAFLMIGVVYGLIALFGLYRSTQTPPVPQEEIVDFVAMPTTTPVTLGIDPRVEPSPVDEKNTYHI